jgi:hypothetical protein
MLFLIKDKKGKGFMNYSGENLESLFEKKTESKSKKRSERFGSIL